jgi:hypothetical protein
VQCRRVGSLLAHRPNLKVKDNENQTPLQSSLDFSESDCISAMLINAGASLDDVLPASLCRFASRSTAAIQALLKRGVVWNQLRDDQHNTPLHCAAATRRLWSADLQATVNMLINVCGCDLEGQNLYGLPCILTAVANNAHGTLRCFINAGADVNCVSRNRETPLDVVSDYQCAVLLIAAGADLDKRDRSGRAALRAFQRSKNCMPVLVAAGADPRDWSEQSIAKYCGAEQVEMARRDIAKVRLDFVRWRALEVCIGLQPLQLDALHLCEILQHSCGPVACVIAFHQWWTIASQ